MAETPSNMIPLGTKAPDFKLLDTCTNRMISLEEIASPKATVIMFICNHCPYVKLIFKKLIEVTDIYKNKGVNFVAINANDAIAYPADAPDKMKETAKEQGFDFPYLFDETQNVAKAYHAACTPDFFVFDENLECVYRGRFDDATPGNKHEPTGKDLSQAIDCILAGKPVSEDQKASVGCNIKWKR